MILKIPNTPPMQLPKHGVAIRIDKKIIGIAFRLYHKHFELSWYVKK